MRVSLGISYSFECSRKQQSFLLANHLKLITQHLFQMMNKQMAKPMIKFRFYISSKTQWRTNMFVFKILQREGLHILTCVHSLTHTYMYNTHFSHLNIKSGLKNQSRTFQCGNQLHIFFASFGHIICIFWAGGRIPSKQVIGVVYAPRTHWSYISYDGYIYLDNIRAAYAYLYWWRCLLTTANIVLS